MACCRRRIAFAAILFFITTPAGSGPWDGRYYPEGFEATVFCHPGETARRDQPDLWSIKNDRLSIEEGSCLLTNPVNVRDMPGVLYDAECWAEGDTSVERVLVIRRREGIEWVGQTYTWRLKFCP